AAVLGAVQAVLLGLVSLRLTGLYFALVTLAYGAFAEQTLFGISALFWLVVLSRVPLSVAYPIVGVSYILIVLLGRFVLHETVPTMRWIGVFVVATGIAIIGLSFRRVAGS
ncbi:MAG: hypothetical protein ACLGHL_10795, partial [Actinomycetota bacterium]